MSVRDVAKAAYDASQSDRVNAARQAMVALLGDPNSEFSTMPWLEAHTPPEVPYTLIVFKDDDSDIRLGVQQAPDSTEWAVWLVESDTAGEWTMLGEQVQSLEHLYLLIEKYLPAAPAWKAGVAYKVGDQVTYSGFTWKCVQAHLSQVGWEPPNVPALWTKVA